jgi:nicotinate-nucleotide pyrophosphorylase (carboxylating)
MLRADVLDLIVKLALREDIGRGDLTSSSLIPASRKIRAMIQAKAPGVLCGMQIAESVFGHLDPNLRFLPTAKDGDSLEPGRELAFIEGSAQSILMGERVALNFLGKLSGIATQTRLYVDKVKGTKAKILDTRKTTPNMRVLEKMAVVTGGGVNHRIGLYDQVLIKDNHLRILKNESIPSIMERARRGVLKNVLIGLEVKNLKELAEALTTRLEYILLDNMTIDQIKQAVHMREQAFGDSKASMPLFEVSGGVNLDNVRAAAETGVERISIGALTHSAPWLDVSLDIVS